jgi:hypothetical protein
MGGRSAVGRHLVVVAEQVTRPEVCVARRKRAADDLRGNHKVRSDPLAEPPSAPKALAGAGRFALAAKHRMGGRGGRAFGWRRRRAFFSVAPFDVCLTQSKAGGATLLEETRQRLSAGGHGRADARRCMHAAASGSHPALLRATWRLPWYNATEPPGSRLPPRTRCGRQRCAAAA